MESSVKPTGQTSLGTSAQSVVIAAVTPRLLPNWKVAFTDASERPQTTANQGPSLREATPRKVSWE